MPSHTSVWNPLHWVSELTHVWRDTRLIVLIAQIDAIYSAILIPFEAGIPIIPGFVELLPANAVPIVAALLFGPAAAWGAGTNRNFNGLLEQAEKYQRSRRGQSAVSTVFNERV